MPALPAAGRVRFHLQDVAFAAGQARSQLIELGFGIGRQRRASAAEGELDFSDLVVLVKAVDRAVDLVDVLRSLLRGVAGVLRLLCWRPSPVWLAASAEACAFWIPACARASTSLMSRAFLAFTSSSSVSRSLIGSICLFTHFLRAKGLIAAPEPFLRLGQWLLGHRHIGGGLLGGRGGRALWGNSRRDPCRHFILCHRRNRDHGCQSNYCRCGTLAGEENRNIRRICHRSYPSWVAALITTVRGVSAAVRPPFLTAIPVPKIHVG